MPVCSGAGTSAAPVSLVLDAVKFMSPCRHGSTPGHVARGGELTPEVMCYMCGGSGGRKRGRNDISLPLRAALRPAQPALLCVVTTAFSVVRVVALVAF